MTYNLKHLPKTATGIAIYVVSITLITAFFLSLYVADGEGFGNAPFIVYLMLAGSVVFLVGLVHLVVMGFEEGAANKQGDKFMISALSAWMIGAFFSMISVISGFVPTGAENYAITINVADVISYTAFGFGIVGFARAGRC